MKSIIEHLKTNERGLIAFIFLAPPILLSLLIILLPARMTLLYVNGIDSFIVGNNVTIAKHNIQSNFNISLNDIENLDYRINLFIGKELGLPLGKICFNYSVDENIYTGLNKSSFEGNIEITHIKNISLYLQNLSCFEILEDIDSYDIKSRIYFNYNVCMPPGDYNTSQMAELCRSMSENGEKLFYYYKKSDLMLKCFVILFGWFAICIIVFNVIEYIWNGLRKPLE